MPPSLPHVGPLPLAGRTQGVGVQEVLRALAEAVRSKDKNARQQLMGLLLRLFFYEELPPEAIQLLVPLFQVPLPLPAAPFNLAAAQQWCQACTQCDHAPTLLLCPPGALAHIAGAGQGCANAAQLVLPGKHVCVQRLRRHTHTLRSIPRCSKHGLGVFYGCAACMASEHPAACCPCDELGNSQSGGCACLLRVSSCLFLKPSPYASFAL
jgi:hypothetical protein